MIFLLRFSFPKVIVAPTVDIPAEVTRVTIILMITIMIMNTNIIIIVSSTSVIITDLVCTLYKAFHFRCCWLSNPPEQQRFSFDLKIWRMWRRRRGRIVKMGLDKEAVVEEDMEVEEDVEVEKKQDWQ